jgi:predicted RNase H-like nuclease
VWTARRIASGNSVTVPAAPPVDRFGLPMQMVA